MSNGIFVVVEQRNGKVQNVGLELIGEATRLKAESRSERRCIRSPAGQRNRRRSRKTVSLWRRQSSSG